MLELHRYLIIRLSVKYKYISSNILLLLTSFSNILLLLLVYSKIIRLVKSPSTPDGRKRAPYVLPSRAAYGSTWFFDTGN